MVALRVVTEVWVPGWPKTKGSLDLMNRRGGGTYVRESVAGSSDWRKLVARAVADERARRGISEPTPAALAVGVRVLFVLPVPIGVAASTPAELLNSVPPTQAAVGDIDKLTRNVLDALQDARAIEDDVQVCKIICNKVYADGRTPGSSHQGALIQCWELLPGDTRKTREQVVSLLGTSAG